MKNPLKPKTFPHIVLLPEASVTVVMELLNVLPKVLNRYLRAGQFTLPITRVTVTFDMKTHLERGRVYIDTQIHTWRKEGCILTHLEGVTLAKYTFGGRVYIDTLEKYTLYNFLHF